MIDWYQRNALEWKDRIISRIVAPSVRVVFFEDLFGADVSLEVRLGHVAEIGAWLGVRIPTEDGTARAILNPRSRINGPNSYRHIPNLEEIVSRFGDIEDY